MAYQGNKAVKISSEILPKDDEVRLFNKEVFVYWNLVNECEGKITNILKHDNITKHEYDILFKSECLKFEKLFFNALRAQKRKLMYEDQIAEFSTNYIGLYHPYNPYLGKYKGAYLRNYQQFD